MKLSKNQKLKYDTVIPILKKETHSGRHILASMAGYGVREEAKHFIEYLESIGEKRFADYIKLFI